MLNSLYSQLKEDKFEDLFQPISKDEYGERLKTKLANSPFKYGYIANISGGVKVINSEAQMDYRTQSKEFFAGLIEQLALAMFEGYIKLNVVVSSIQTYVSQRHEFNQHIAFGSFEGSLEAFTRELMSEQELLAYFTNIQDKVLVYGYETTFKDIKITNFKTIGSDEC